MRRPLDDVMKTLHQYPWDSKDELTEFGPAELRYALDSFLDGALSAEQLEAWANAIEGRDDIGFRPSALIDLVAKLAKPYTPLAADARISPAIPEPSSSDREITR
jgi:hypothetical protein